MINILKTMQILFLISCISLGGNYGDAFMEFGISTRGYAMARTSGSISSGISSVYLNPAGLAYLQNQEFSALYLNVFGLAGYHYLGVSLPFSEKIQSSISWMRFSVNLEKRPDYFIDSDLTQEERRSTIISHGGRGFGNFSDRENAFLLSFAKLFEFFPRIGWTYNHYHLNVPVALNLKLIYKSLAGENARGIGLDLGLRFDFRTEDFFDMLPSGRFNVSLCIKDAMGTNLYWTTKHQDYIPPGLDSGFSLDQKFNAIKSVITVATERDFRYDNHFRTGFEWCYNNVVSIRAGSNYENLFIGCGIKVNLKGFQSGIDYALLPHPLGNVHRISFIVRML